MESHVFLKHESGDVGTFGTLKTRQPFRDLLHFRVSCL